MNTVTISGNLTDELVLRFTSDGQPVTNGTIAADRSVRRNGEWHTVTDGFFNFSIFGKIAEHATESLTQGSLVTVTGRLTQDSWEADDGTTRRAVKIVANDIAKSLRYGDEHRSDQTDPAAQ